MKVDMRTSDKISALLGVAVLAASASAAGVFQATREGGELYAVQGRETLRIGRLGGIEEEVEIPAGASVQDLEPTAFWLAGRGHSPTPEGTKLLVLEQSEARSTRFPSRRWPARNSAGSRSS